LGLWTELSLKTDESSYSVEVWESKLGGLMGWSIGNKKVFFDTNIGIGWGYAWASLQNPYNTDSTNDHSIILMYKLSLKLGIKL
jgi:hypothetical protein